MKQSQSDDLDSSVTIIEEVEVSAPEDHNTTIDLSGDEDEFADLPEDLDKGVEDVGLDDTIDLSGDKEMEVGEAAKVKVSGTGLLPHLAGSPQGNLKMTTGHTHKLIFRWDCGQPHEPHMTAECRREHDTLMKLAEEATSNILQSFAEAYLHCTYNKYLYL